MMISQLQSIEQSKGRRTATALRETGARPGKSTPVHADPVAHPDYLCPATEERLFGPEAPTVSVPPWTPRPQFDEGREEVELPKPAANLSRQDEALLFMRYNYARYRLARLAEKQRRRFAPRRVPEILAWNRRADENRAALANANMGLVVAMVKRMRITSVEPDELVSEGNMALLRTVDKFDVARGFKFSTYACGAILRSLFRLTTKAGTYRHRFPVNFLPEMERSDESERRSVDQRGLAIDELRGALLRNRASLTDVERLVLGARFAVDGYSRVHTLTEVSGLVGLSGERVRQVQNGALRKLRMALEPTSSPRRYRDDRQAVLRRTSPTAGRGAVGDRAAANGLGQCRASAALQ